MKIKCFSIRGYAHLYRSLMRFARLSAADAQDLVYQLNTANLDSYRETYPQIKVRESSSMAFMAYMGKRVRPYRTEIQLCKALQALEHNVIYESLSSVQREAMWRTQIIMSELALSFYRVYGAEIDNPKTVYSACADHLIPDRGEPSVCMFIDWLMLRSA